MAKRIYNFTEKTTLDLTDEFVLQETSDGTYKKTLFSTIFDTLYASIPSGFGLTVGSSIKQELTYIPISSSFPYWCLNQPDTTIVAANIPDYASAMRNYKLRMKPWSDNISTWDCTAWSTSGSAGTLTFKKNANLSGTVSATDSATLTFSASQSLSVGDILILSTGAIVRVVSGATTSWIVDIKVTIAAGTARIATYEELMIRALYYAQEKHGSYTNWFCLTLTADIGNITAGDYAISGLSVASNTITIVTAATAGSGSGTFSDLVEIYPFRIPASSDAHHYSWAGHTLVNAGGDEHTLVAGLMRLDYMQQITGDFVASTRAPDRSGAIVSYVNLAIDEHNGGNDDYNRRYSFDSAGSPNARTDKRTHGADAGVYTYIYAGTVN